MLRRSILFGWSLAILLAVIDCSQQPRPRETWTGNSYYVPSSESHNSNVTVDPSTHELMHGQSSWAFADSARLRQKRDEILTALMRLGGDAVACDAPPEKRGFANALYWKYDGLYLKVRAEKRVTAIYSPLPWIASIEVFPQMPYECLRRPS